MTRIGFLAAPTAATRRRAVLAATATAALLGGLLAASPALADTAPIGGLPATVSSDALPTAQINGIAWAQVIIGDTVYVGGSFTSARPAGSALGFNEIPRSNLLAYSLSTGELVPSFAPVVNGQVTTLAASPDGTRLYIGGQFTQIDASRRYRLAAFDTSTRTLIKSFAPTINTTVDSIAATNSTVYAGGNFSSVNGVARLRIVALAASNGAVLPFTASADGGRVRGIVVSPDQTKIVIAGSFTTLNGSSNPGYGMGALDAITGASLPWAINSVVRNAGTSAAIYSLNSDSDSVYGSGYHFGAGGNLEGIFRSDWNGNLVWLEDCHGDTYDTTVANGVIYGVGHAHYCGTSGSFPQTSPWTIQRTLAWSKATSNRTINAQTLGYANWAGTASPTPLNFYPDMTVGDVSGSSQAAWSVKSTSNYVVYAGEFPKVNGKGQQGLVRFAVKSIAPNADGPRLSGGDWVPTLTTPASGSVLVTWLANHDRDSQYLDYQLQRDGVTIYTANRGSRAWFDRPQMSYLDTGLESGSTHTYRLKATDPNGNVATGSWVSGTASGTATISSYAKAVITDGAVDYWRLNDASTGTMSDLTGTNTAGYISGSSATAPGAITGDADTAANFKGNGIGLMVAKTPMFAPDTVSVEAWFSTTSTTGGKIVGFGNNSTKDSGAHDRAIYMDGSGRVYFAVNQNGPVSLQSGTGFNNGQWHHVVATYTDGTIALYLDGTLIGSKFSAPYSANYSGYWRIGGDATWAGAKYFTGSIDEVAVYGKALAATTISQHYLLGKTGTAPNIAPTASFTSSANGLLASVNGSGSSDTDGTITSYAWDFGDGVTTTGATASHSYAAGGTYTIRLTVTDNAGATATTSSPVTVVAPAPVSGIFAADSFDRTTPGGLGTATTGGAWSLGAAASSYSTSGTGNLTAAKGATTDAYLTSASSTSADVTTKVTLDAPPADGSVFATVVARRVAAGLDYRARVTVGMTGAVALTLQRGGTTLLGKSVAGVSYAAGDVLNVRVQVTGVNPTTLSAKVWKAGTPEPAAWTVSTTDSTSELQTSGYVGITLYAGSGLSNGPAVARFDTFSATTVG